MERFRKKIGRNLQMQVRDKAFTLAEVLITITVIGVVAALTIPTLIQSYKKSVVETRLAKFYSVMNNAIRMAEIDYGPQSTWTDYHINQVQDEEGQAKIDNGDKYDALVDKYFAPYLKIIASEEMINNVKDVDPQKIYYLSDGTAFSYNLTENREIYFHPNNPKKCLAEGNRGSCMFAFVFIPTPKSLSSSNQKHFKYNIGNGLQPDLYQWDGDENKLYSGGVGSCLDGSGNYCTEIIRRNG